MSRMFLENVKRVLQYLLNQSLPLKHPNDLAQSSAALSTVQDAIEQETAQMERTELSMW